MFGPSKTIDNKQSRKNTPKNTLQHKSRERNLQTPRSSKKTNHLDLSRSLLNSTFQNHPGDCLCKQCTCGRHMCNLTSQPPSLTLATTYNLQYKTQTPFKNRQVPRPASARIPQSPMMYLKSSYLQDFKQQNGDALERPKPQNLLNCKGGPIGELTSYSREYPGHRGKNQHVPMNPEASRGGLKFNGNTTYSKQFGKNRGRSSENAKPPDQFSMTGSWFGASSYKDQYQNPKNHVSKDKENNINKSQCISKSQSSQMSYKNPSSHFKTTYVSEFLGVSKPLCPVAKKIVEMEEELANSKINFKQNSNFKGMDSRYSSLAKNGKQF